MPFNTTSGVYTAPAAATNAVPGKVIASSDWNTIFTDIQNALTAVSQRQITFLPRVVSSPGNISIGVSDLIVLIGASVPVINLPAASTKINAVNIIGNATGIFSGNNSLIVPTGSDTIDGLASIYLSNDYQSVILYPLPGGNWRIL